jgi:SAM-dependent methyltransferase
LRLSIGHNILSPGFLPMYRVVLDQLKLSEKHLFLDAGCGAGLFGNLAIEAGVEMIGVDAAPGLLELARLRNPLNNFLEEDLEALPFADDSFDVVTGFNSFQYAGSFENALMEAKRVTKPRGRMVPAIWAKPEISDAANVLKAIGTLLPPPPPGTPGPFALSEDGKIESVLEAKGLKLKFKAIVACPFLYGSLYDGIKSFLGTGPTAATMEFNDKQSVEETIARALQPFRVTEDLRFL